ncbi:MAG: C25 family cysteine peptidase, partial [Candidatus Omnitrophica bacterium]|nr:C25 family cysteine peptidase [Candidatus Omnitrophota bacterium]
MTGNKPLWKNRIVLMVMMLAGCSVLVITPEGLAQVNDAAYVLRIRTNTLTAQVKAVVMKKGINNFDRVEINGLSNIGAPGQPVLPVRTVKFLIPSGQDVDDISIGWTSKKQISGSFTIEPGQHPVSMNFSGPVSITAPDPAIYASSTPFPGKLYDVVSTQSLCGYKILILNLYPVEYIPASGALFYYDTMNVLVNLKTAQSSSADPLYRGLASDRERVQSFVDNPSNAESYPRVSIASAAPTYKYVIITSSTFESYAGANNLSTLIAHRVAQDSTLTTAIVTTTWIYATYSGLRPDGSSDNATKIRNFITDYYTNNGTEYVFLVGDADYGDTDSGGVASGEREASPIVPTRGLFATVPSVPEETDSDIAADLYYACLGGTYDSDADGVYGEANDGSGGTDIDLLAEVYVGRAPVDSTTELSNFIAKTIAYENSTSDNLTKACMAGETLDDYTQGKSYLEEIRSGSSANGYTTVGMA